MRLVAIPKARALAFIEIDQLNKQGTVRLADCIAPIVERFKFQIFPTKIEDFNLENGVRFGSGITADHLVIDSLVIYSRVAFVETLRSTTDSRNVLLDILEWGKGAFGLTYNDGMITRWGYISQLVFDTDFPILAEFSSPLLSLAKKTSTVTGELFGGLEYQPSSITIGHDPTMRKNAIASLIIQHRSDIPFSDNRYFSEAPLPTDLHIQFLEEFEADVLKSQK